MEILDEFHLVEEIEKMVENVDMEPRRRRKFKNCTCEIFFEEMSDFEFLRTFCFSKEGVRHLTALLGNKETRFFLLFCTIFLIQGNKIKIF